MSFFGGEEADSVVVLEPPIRDGARLNNSGARLDEGARLGDSCAGPASGARDSSIYESSCKTVNTAATISARAVTVATASQQPQDTIRFIGTCRHSCWPGIGDSSTMFDI